ncbi:MAG: hypothetical protein HY722_04145 [Planctomycetes bacterium]|nr:hypothetical protein [Planctomycetota bacterium]
MNAALQRLLELARLDEEILELARAIEQKPEFLRLEGLKMDRQRQSAAALVEARKHVLKEDDLLELQVKGNAQRAGELAGKQNTVKTNEEYQALSREIASLKSTNSVLEDRILEGMTRADELAAQVRTEEARRKELEAHLARVQGELERQIASHREELQRREAARAEFVRGIAPDHLARYERVFEKTRGVVVVPVIDYVCQGCHIEVTPQVVNLLMGDEEIVYCRHCNRILYLAK